MSRTYTEDFDGDRGGWWGWISNSAGPRPLEHRPGVVTSRSPWWIDYNHAPPGAGYLHMLSCTGTRGSIAEPYAEGGGPHRLAAGEFPTDYTNARFALRLRGELEKRDAELLLLVQMQSALLLLLPIFPLTALKVLLPRQLLISTIHPQFYLNLPLKFFN